MKHQKYVRTTSENKLVKAKEQKELLIEFPIPLQDDYNPSYDSMSAEFKKEISRQVYPMMGSFSTSFFG